jgi:hypothetical protein
MQLDFHLGPTEHYGQTRDVLHVGSQTVPIQFARNLRARRYIIRIQQDGSIRVLLWGLFGLSSFTPQGHSSHGLP